MLWLVLVSGTAEHIFNLEGGGGLENERRRRKFVGGPGCILPQKIVKSRGSKMVFSAFSMRYFFKENQPG